MTKLKSTKVEKPTYRREIIAPLENKKWGRLWDATGLTGLNKTEIYRLINEGIIDSFIYKFRPDATSGVRLINLEQLAAYLDKRAAEAKAEVDK